VEHIEAPAPVHATCLDSPGDPSGMANLSVEEPDALMRARPGPWEPWRVTARATQPGAALWWVLDHQDTQDLQVYLARPLICHALLIRYGGRCPRRTFARHGTADITQILEAARRGEAEAAARLLPFLYNELRRLAASYLDREQPGQTLQPTALVHEAYQHLVGREDAQTCNSRGHFFAAAEAMRGVIQSNDSGELVS
jgi:hypothetical protein